MAPSVPLASSALEVRRTGSRTAVLRTGPRLAILRDSESDSPTHCHDCGRLIEHGLTDTGLRYVSESVLHGFCEGKQNPVTVQWVKAYGERLPDELDDVELSIASALALYTWLPIDRAWFARDDLRRHATLAGWTEDALPLVRPRGSCGPAAPQFC
jgi:hypothetical protein